MKEILITLLIIMILILIILIVKKLNKKVKKTKIKQTQTNTQTNYQKQKIMSDYEKYFYNVLTQNFSNDYLIIPQVNLASIIKKIKDFPKQYQNELYRNIDFGIFDKEKMIPILLIEINDKTHKTLERIERDKKVKEICKIAEIKLITFYSKYDNKKEYIITRIKNELKKD